MEDHLEKSSSISDKKTEVWGGQVTYPGSHLGLAGSGPSFSGPPWLHPQGVSFFVSQDTWD